MKETNTREITGKKSKKTPQQMLEKLDRKAMELTGGRKIPMKPEDEARYAAMEKKFAKIDDQNIRTQDLRARKEKMLKEQAAFVPPTLPGSYLGAKPATGIKSKSNPYSALEKKTTRTVRLTQE